MPKFGVDKLLTTAQIDEVTEYILSFTGRDTNKAAANSGADVFLKTAWPAMAKRAKATAKSARPA